MGPWTIGIVNGIDFREPFNYPLKYTAQLLHTGLGVHYAPGRPQDLRVLDCGSRRVKLAWLDPTDDRSPILQYIVQYQQESPSLLSAHFTSIELTVPVWRRPVVRIHLSANWQTMAAGTELFATISGLQPATHYKFRVVAENELGAGEPSENIVVRTEGEAPTGEPQSLSVTAIASDQLRVSWTAPVQNLWNGEILGYYVGYREHG
uniref:Fibronectin type-III domain-containing protein n=1 Tax=Timema douglasi TaxID=61478 RepID=A0A7R8VBH4_TIMDO|nr:unnamed protein product [Timema douglasi]